MPANAVSKQELDPSAAARRFKMLALSLLGSYALLVLVLMREGEFWPFSRFPMFSRAGRPWERALVREVRAKELDQPLSEAWEDELPGRSFPLYPFRINQDDLSKVVQRMRGRCSPEDAALLANYFEEPRQGRHLVLYAVRGSLRPDRSIRVRYLPLAVLETDGVHPVSTPEPSPQP